MKKIEILDKENFNKLQENNEGNYEIPANMEIYIEESNEDNILILQNQLNALILPDPPSENELIEYGKMNHPYYEILGLRNNLQEQINSLNGNNL